MKINFIGKNNKEYDIVINSFGKCRARTLCLPRKKLWQEGVHTLYIDGNNIKVKTAADGTFKRPWGQGLFLEKEQIYP